jgi:hypothetical protein
VAQTVGAADLGIEDWLGTRDLAEVIRTAFDPAVQLSLAERRAAAVQAARDGIAWDGPEPGVRPRDAAPLFAAAHPDRYEHDGAVSTTYWSEDWPHQAYPTALGPLLGDGSHRRAVSLVYEPLSPRRAERAVMRDRTERDVALRVRRRMGQIVPEHERAAAARALAQDSERAAGHGMVRFAAYMTVTVDDPEQLADARAKFESDARQVGIEPRAVWFSQDAAFGAAALPLGLGLPARRW